MQSLLATGRPSLIGMVHLEPLPGSPGYHGDMAAILERAERDAAALAAGGVDGLLVENMGDVPYLRGRVEPETVAAMTLAVARLAHIDLPCGVQVLAAANREALAVAIATGAGFVRVEGFAYAHVADEGWIDACAGELLRARAALGSSGTRVAIWADVHKKHAAHAVTGDLTVADLAQGAAFNGADAVIVTGPATGQPTRPEDVAAAATAGLPVIVGSGVTADNVASYRNAQALIVGSALKHDGDWRQPVDPQRVKAIRRAIQDLASLT